MTTLQIAKPTKERVIAECRQELAMNFETPAQRILAFWGSFLNVTAVEMEKLMRKAAN